MNNKQLLYIQLYFNFFFFLIIFLLNTVEYVIVLIL